MLRKEDLAVIKSLHRRGVFLKDIAGELGVHPKTVSRALKDDPSTERERQRPESKLEPYKPKIDHLLSEGVWNAKVILREIQAATRAGTAFCANTYSRSESSDPARPRCALKLGLANRCKATGVKWS